MSPSSEELAAPVAVTIPNNVFQAAVDALMTLPAGQVFEVLFALRTQATPVYPEPEEEVLPDE